MCAALLLVVLASGRARGDDGPWNGFDALRSLATRAGVNAETPPTVDLSSVTADDAIVVVAPTRSLPVFGLGAFMRAGGRVALIDDFGAGASMLSAYQVSRTSPPTGGPALRDDPRFPLAFPQGDHPLTTSVPVLVGNEPSALHHSELKPIFVLGHSDAALVLAGAVGAGRLVVVGDSSVFINQLMQLPSHRRFAANLLHYLARPGAHVWLVLPGSELRGEFGGSDASRLARLNKTLRELSHPDFSSTTLWVLSFSMLTVFGSIALVALPRTSPYLKASLFPNSGVQVGAWAHAETVREHASGPLWVLIELRKELEAAIAHRLGIIGGINASTATKALSSLPDFQGDPNEARALMLQLEELTDGLFGPSRRKLSVQELQAIIMRGEKLLSQLSTGDA